MSAKLENGGVSKGSTINTRCRFSLHTMPPSVPSLHLGRRQNLFEVNQAPREVPEKFTLHTSQGFLSRQAVNDVCVVFVGNVLAHRAVNFAVVKFDCFLHDPDTLNFGAKQSNKFQTFFRHEGGKA